MFKMRETRPRNSNFMDLTDLFMLLLFFYSFHGPHKQHKIFNFSLFYLHIPKQNYSLLFFFGGGLWPTYPNLYASIWWTDLGPGLAGRGRRPQLRPRLLPPVPPGHRANARGSCHLLSEQPGPAPCSQGSQLHLLHTPDHQVGIV